METTELLKKVRKIEIKTKGLISNIFSGEYHSAFKGRGMSFSEVRAYQFGDDVRHIDWNVTARTGVPFVKVFEEERELTVMLLVDVSGSAFFGTRRQFRIEWMTEIAAVLAFSAASNNDKVGLILFSDQIELFIPPKKGRQHILRIVREMLNASPGRKATRLDTALEYFYHVIKKRSICFVLSDFLSEGFDTILHVAARKHDMIGLLVQDPMEENLPDTGLWYIEDAESGAATWIDTSDPRTRQAQKDQSDRRHQQLRTLFRRSSADLISLSTDDAYVNALMHFFQQRMR